MNIATSCGSCWHRPSVWRQHSTKALNTNRQTGFSAEHGRQSRCHAASTRPTYIVEDSQPGPSNAFTPGKEAETRQALFNRISPVYDEVIERSCKRCKPLMASSRPPLLQLNTRLSFGQHWVWKQMTVKWSGAKQGHRALDVCCGSGDIAMLLAKTVGPKGQVVGLDFAAEMLSDAAMRQRQQQLPGLQQYWTPMEWVQGDAMAMPFPDNEFDAATMGYGLRNVADIPKALRELHRILKPGATVAILDFNNCTNSLVDGMQAWFLDNLVVPTARSYGLEEEYEYLRPSIKAFPTGAEQEALALQAGFHKAKHYEISFGLMGVLVATKGR